MEIRVEDTVTERPSPTLAARPSLAADEGSGAVAEAERALGTGPDVPLPKVGAQALRGIHMFADLADADLAWIAAHTDRLELEAGDIFMQPGRPAEWMFLAIDGVLQGRREQLGPNSPAFIIRAGEVNGAVPFSRMTVFSGTGRAVTRSTVGLFPRSLFPELLQRVPVLVQRFVVLLLDRVRDSTRRDAQFEKLSALGKLSAGLAHELNNPAAAVMRATSDANLRIDERGDITAALIEGGVTADSVRRIDSLRRAALMRLRAASAAGKPVQSVASATLDRSDREDALAVWLRDVIGSPDPWASAPIFVDAEIDRDAIETALSGVPDAARGVAVRWLETGLAAQTFFHEADAAMHRITQLLDALRTYTNRDRMREMVDVDIREGIESTIALFDGRARSKGVTIERVLDPVPRIRAYPGDLNQVWANLLDNAIDAVPAGGVITIRTSVQDGQVTAEFRDNGPGIPPELCERVFEPFFTTKDVGAGVGLGLDVARRVVVDMHSGQLTLSSCPGDTRFCVRLPLTTIGTFGL